MWLVIGYTVRGNPRIILPPPQHDDSVYHYHLLLATVKIVRMAKAPLLDLVGVHEFNNGLFCSEPPWVVCTLRERALVLFCVTLYDVFACSPASLASSALPYGRTPPTWLKITHDDVVEQICKLARKGLTPSQIGVTLRDSHGIPQVRFVTGNKILRVLKSNGQCLWRDIIVSIS